MGRLNRFFGRTSATVVGVVCLALVDALAQGQAPNCPQQPPACPVPGVIIFPAPPAAGTPTPAPGTTTTPPGTATTPGATTPPGTTPGQTPAGQPQAQEPNLSPERIGAVGGENVALATPNMIGDSLIPSGGCTQSQLLRMRIAGARNTSVPLTPPAGGGGGGLGGNGIGGIGGGGFLGNFGGGVLGCCGGFGGASAGMVCDERLPSGSHTFKIADNNNPLAQDRVFLDYSYYNDVNGGFNREHGLPGTTDAHQEMFGFEKGILNGNASVSLVLPLNTLVDGVGGTTSTDIGNLTVAGKYVLWRDRASGDGVSAGLAVTLPTGPRGFGGVEVMNGFHDTTIQPFVAGVWRGGGWYVLGFSSIDVATDPNDVTLWYNDLGVGYLVRQDRTGDRFLSGIAPTLELHVNTPVNHRGIGNMDDLAGTPDWVDITSGFTLEFNRRSTFAVGVSVPVTGPQPFGVEALAQLNLRF